MYKCIRPVAAATILLVAVPSMAAAHPDAGMSHGFLHGLNHPFSGWDHLLAMFAVGLWAAQRGGRAVWSLPLAFIGTMMAAGAIAMAGVGMPGIELGILTSVFVLGVLIAMAAKVPVVLAHLTVAVFAIFHGAAHGAEMPAGMGGVSYAAGFAVGTAALHLAGAALGISLQRGLRSRPQVWVRLAGASVCVAGVGLLLLGN